MLSGKLQVFFYCNLKKKEPTEKMILLIHLSRKMGIL